jgi:selenocysteine-specific translation elongation factor
MNIAVIGDKGLSKDLGKKGTSSDIILYNTSFQGKNFTFIEPEKYPEKIQTLFQVLNMSQFAILYITRELEKSMLGECILSLDMLGKQGIIVLEEVAQEEIKPFLLGTILEKYTIISRDIPEIMKHLFNFQPECSRETKVLIDHSFIVKSVGLVALGTVVSGEVKKHDTLKIYPANKEVSIKSIQINDKDVERAVCYDRVGLCLKGIDLQDAERGSVISKNVKTVKTLDVRIIKNKFYKDDVPSNVMCVVGLQYINAKFSEGKLDFAKEIVIDGEKVTILTPDKKMRICGLAEY